MTKLPKAEDLQDEPGADDRFLRGVQKAVNTPPKPFTPKAKGKRKKGVGAKRVQPASET